MDPEISVVITTIPGRTAFLEEALESLVRQSLPPDEVVLVMEGEDPAWDHLEKWQSRLPLRTVHRLEVAGRAGPAKTLGLRTARGKFVALMDDDDLALPHRLEVEGKFLTDHPEYGWVCGRVELFQDPRTLGIWPEDPAGPVDLPRLFRGNVVAYSTVMLTRKAVEALDGFREDLPLAPDYDAWMRLAAQGIQGFLLNEVVGRYRRHGANLSARERVRAEVVVDLLRRYRDGVEPKLAREAIRRALRDLARVLEQEGKGRDAARIWWEAWREGRKPRDLTRSVIRWIFG